MAEKTFTEKLGLAGEKAGISLGCYAAQKYVELQGKGKSDGDAAALKLASWVTMKPGGRAEKYLNHFLDGSGTAEHFETADLLASEKEIRKRVYSEIQRKRLGIRVGTEKQPISFDPEITLFQKNYLDQDWWFALGSYALRWEIAGEASDRVFVKVSGEGPYSWHPQDIRITQCLHEAGDSLIKAGKARPFSIVAKPAMIVASKNYDETLKKFTFHAYNPGKIPSLASQVKTGLGYKIQTMLPGSK
jgi:hypothetical protein